VDPRCFVRHLVNVGRVVVIRPSLEAELEEQAKQRAGERARQLQHDRIMGYADNEDDELFKLKKHVHEKQNEQRRREEQRQRRHQQQQEDAEEQINGDENRAPARPTSPGVARDGGGNALSHEAAAAAVFDRRRNLPRPLPELPSRRMTSNSSLLNEFKTFSFDYDKQPLSELTDEMELRAKLLEPRSRMNDISV